MADVIAANLPGARVGVLSGPSFAAEIARGLPAALVAASTDGEVAAAVQACFGGDRLRIYTSSDVTGVCVGGALKNVIAIAVGCCDGFGFGDNARAALITRGLAEMGRLAERMGGRALTLAGLAGLGDLVLTCTGDLSRNRQVGLALARGDALAGHPRATGPHRRRRRHRAHRARSRRTARRRHADHARGRRRPARRQAGARRRERSARARHRRRTLITRSRAPDPRENVCVVGDRPPSASPSVNVGASAPRTFIYVQKAIVDRLIAALR